MPAKDKFEAIFHYVDDKGFGGDISISSGTTDDLFVAIATVQEAAVKKGWHGRPADKEREYKPTYVKNNYAPRATAAPKTAVDAAVEVLGGSPTQECPVCGKDMVFRASDGTLARTGFNKGKPLPDTFTCPNCQKRIWLKTFGGKPQGSEEIPF